MTKLLVPIAIVMASAAVFAKLPAPSDDAKAKAAEAAAKSAWSAKVDGYLLCKSQDKVAAGYYVSAKAAGKDTKPTAATPACADPGPFAYLPPGAAASQPAASTAANPAGPAGAKAPEMAAKPAKKS